MTKAITSLIHQIIAAAKAQGLSQAQLAERAGLTAVGLSKAKQRGDLRASSLEALAAQVGLVLQLGPAGPRPSAAEAIRSGDFFSRTGTAKSGS